MALLCEDITEPTIGAFYEVHHQLGHGFLESVYERAMVIAIRKRGLRVERQVPVAVYFDGQVVGEYRVDLIVEDRVMVELKAAKALDATHDAQLINCLRATSIEVGLLLHFGIKPAFHRRILSNDRKPDFARRALPGVPVSGA
jgi:GxxExxY protein